MRSRSASCSQILGRGYRFEGLTLEQAKAKDLSHVTVELCYHEHIDKNYLCSDCGMQFALAVQIGNTETLFDTFEDAIRYAGEHDGCIVKLLQDITLDNKTAGSLMDGDHICLINGEYTLDLAGKALNIGRNDLDVDDNCDLTIADSVGGGKVTNGGMGNVRVGANDNKNAKLTVTGGDFTARVISYTSSALVLKGGSFGYVISAQDARCSPFVYLSDGYTFAFKDPTGGNSYANEGNVNIDYSEQNVKDVTVVPVPLTVDEQPTDLTFYLTSREADKYVKFVVSTIEEWQGERFRITFEKEDGAVIKEAAATTYEKQQISFSAASFKVSDSGSYRIKLELKGYVLYTAPFTVTVAECEHPGCDGSTGKCTRCGCDLAAAIVKDGKTTGYVSFADALAAAQTDANKGCTLKLLAGVSGTVDVDTGDFGIDLGGNVVGGLKVKKSAKVNVSGGRIKGGVTVAKTAQLTASNTYFAGAINCVGGGDFKDCIFAGAVSPKAGSSMKLNACEIHGALSVSGNAEAEMCIVSGTVTVNNGGTLEIISGTFGNTLTAKEGSTLIISGGSYVKAGAENNVDLTLSGGEFTNITVNGQHLIDCLAEGKAFEDMVNGGVIDGRVGIAGKVKVVDHTHTCEWKTATHEKLCGCGFVEATDRDAPVISGIADGMTYYGAAEFTVTDENDFTVWVDGKPVTPENGKYTLAPDNAEHTVTATDTAGNTVSIAVRVNKLYTVTLPTGAGYTVSGAAAARHGTDYEFVVKIADGYSKTGDYRVLVNGREPDSAMGDETGDTFLVTGVSGDMTVTVSGIADITPPTAELTNGTHKFNAFMNAVTFGLFFKETQTVTVTASDAGSGLFGAEYLLSETAFADRDAVTGGWTALTLAEGTASFNIEPDKKAYVYVRVTDVSGNITVINSDGVVIYTDAEAITGAVDFTIRGKADVSFDVRLNGNTVAALYNGDTPIDSSSYTVSADGTVTLKNSYLSTLAAGEYTIRVQYDPMGEKYRTGDEPAVTSVKLTVDKKTPVHDHKPNDAKNYNGKPIGIPTFNTDSDGALTVEYKPADADDPAYTAVAPKTVGIYTVRITTAETDTFKAFSSTMTYEIAPKEVTVIGAAVGVSKIYDGTAAAKITAGGTINGLIDGDDVAIVIGKAAYSDKNVGGGKTVVFTDFAISGDGAANYVLSAQPAGTTADITQKELTVAGLRVRNKPYDGKNTAEIDGTPTLAGVVDGDVLELVNGIPTFDSVTVGKNIPVSFTPFTLSGDSTTVGNYTLTQPGGITADIAEYAADGSEYGVNSRDWLNTAFVVTARQGYQLSLTDTADGEWSDTLTASEETGDGRLTFYVKNTETGAILRQ